jgi:hypothetical protein
LKDRYEKIIEMADAKLFHSEDECQQSFCPQIPENVTGNHSYQKTGNTEAPKGTGLCRRADKIKERELDLEEARLRKSP